MIIKGSRDVSSGGMMHERSRKGRKYSQVGKKNGINGGKSPGKGLNGERVKR